MSQNEKILDYIKDTGSITPLDALREFGCMRLSARIFDLKRDGHKITVEKKNTKNRYGEPVSYAVYKLEE